MTCRMTVGRTSDRRQWNRQYSVEMTEKPDSLGKRLARYRKQLGFDSTQALAARTGGRVSASVLQNIESGRKQDISVAQLLEVSRALGISPLLLLAPLETPTALLDLAGLGDDLRGMTAIEFDEWVRGTNPPTQGRTAALAARWRVDLVRLLIEELRDWRRADETERRASLLDPKTHLRSPFTELDALAQRQREQRIDRLCADLGFDDDPAWVERPWRDSTPEQSLP